MRPDPVRAGKGGAEIRLRRRLGVFAAPRRRRHAHRRFPRPNLVEYPVPVHADIPEVDAILLDRFDDPASVLGVKGVLAARAASFARPGRS